MVTGELVTAITHDLRQPLTAVEMNVAAAIVFLQRSTPHVIEAIDALNDALDQQRRVRDALQVLQHLAVQPELANQTIDLADVAREVVGIVKRDAVGRGVTVELHLEGPPAAIAGDVVLVRQALVNIVRDAIDATALLTQPTERDPVRIIVRPAAADSTTAEVHVMHAGEHRVSGLTSWSLALARSVVAVHGATIAFEGEPPNDANVVMRWPTWPTQTSPPDRLSDG